jgi:uncharacterized protein YndB with AHSA1/START domain
MDVRPGGAWSRSMRAPNGSVIHKHGIYRELVAPERLVLTYITDDAAGIPCPGTLVTVTFADLDGKTRLTLHQAVFQSVAVRDDHAGGWTGASNASPNICWRTRCSPRSPARQLIHGYS